MNKDIRKRTRDWTKKSEKPIPYHVPARFSDWVCATRDARRGLPALPPPDRQGGESPELSTPRMMLLGQIGLGRIEKEWIVYQAEVADLNARLEDLLAEERNMANRVDDAKKRLDVIRGQETDLKAKKAGEDQTSEHIVALRRAKAAAAVLERHEAALRDAEANLEKIRVDIAKTNEQIAVRLRIAQRRASMIETHTRRRCAAYLTRLVRKHPEGARLNALMRPQWPDRADWARASEETPIIARRAARPATATTAQGDE